MNSKNKSYRPVLILAPGVLAGAEKVVLTGLAGLRDLGLNPLMVIIRETRAPQFAENFHKAIPEGIESLFIESTKAFDLNLPKRLKLALSTQPLPLILHSHGFKALIACYMMKGKTPHLHTHHGNTGHTLKVRIYEKLAMMTMKTCNQVIAVSEKMKTELSDKLNPYQQITVVENMLSLTNAAKIRSARNNKAPSDLIKLLYVGRLSPEKGLLPFLQVLEKSSVKDHFHLTILGDGIEKKLIEAFIKDHNLGAQITMHGFVSDPANYFIDPDLLIMPSLREGLPMTLIESLASGMPVLANNVGAISSMLIHNHNGFFARDNSATAWEEALTITTQDYKSWVRTAMNEALSIEERFSLSNWAKKTKELYDRELIK